MFISAKSGGIPHGVIGKKGGVLVFVIILFYGKVVLTTNV